MSERDSSISMNSLMEAIYGDHRTEYVSENQDHCIQQIPQFMQSLTDHLIQLCVTQGFADNVNRTLNPWIKQFNYHHRNPRIAIEGFLKDFIRLFHQQTQKINKYGEKKLKYLTQTVSRQIFTQIMRMACDLKLQSVNRMNYQKTEHHRINNLNILAHSISKLFVKDKYSAFKYLKKIFVDEINKEQKFVQKFKKSINKIDLIAKRKNKNKLWKAISFWRRRNIELSQQQSDAVYQSAHKFFKSVLPDIVKSWHSNPFGWTTVVAQHLSYLVNDFLGPSQGTVVDFIVNPNACQNSLNYSGLSSYRSGISQISSISIGQCLKADQIKYDNNNRFVIIPLIASEQIGVIKISWADQLPIIFFNKAIRLIQLLRSILSQFSKISTRLAYYNSEYQSNVWNENLFQLSFKEQIVKPIQIQHIMQNANLKFLQVYHDSKSATPCVKYGKHNNTQLPENIYKLIWQKLQSSKYFELERENVKFAILGLENGEGFCRYAFQFNDIEHEKDNQTHNVIIKCMIPLLMKNLGKIGCSVCNISVKQLIPSSVNQSISLIKQSAQVKIDSKYMMMVKNAENMSEAQHFIYSVLKDSCAPIPIYARIFYPVDQSKNIYIYKNRQQQNSKLISIQIPKSLLNENFCTAEWGETDTTLITLIKSLHCHPLFEDPQVYLYQHERKNKMKIIAKKIGRRAVLTISTYSQHCQNQMLQLLNKIGGQIEQNTRLFTKKDICNWSSQILCRKQIFSIQNQAINSLLKQINQLQVPQLLEKLCKQFNKEQDYFVWKVKSNKSNLITSSIKQEFNQLIKFPFQLLVNEPIQSQQTIKGSHRTIRISKSLGKKLQQFLSYIPNFESESEKQQLAEAIMDRIQGQGVGQLIDPSYTAICQYLSQVSLFDKYRHQFVSVPIAYKQSVYVFMLVFNREHYISTQIFQTISSAISRIAPIILAQKYKQMEAKTLNFFYALNKQKQGLLLGKQLYSMRYCVKQFYANFTFKRERILLLSSMISKLKQTQIFGQLKKGFRNIKTTSLQYKNKYQFNCQVLIKRLTKIIDFSPFFIKTKNIYLKSKSVQAISQIINFNLKDTACVELKGNYFTFFNFIKLNYQTFLKANKCSKIASTKKLVQRLQKIKNHQFRHYFMKDFEILLTFKRSLKMLQQQFILLDIKSINSCVEFLQNRISLILQQCFPQPLNFQIINSISANLNYQTQQFLHIKDSQFIILVKNQYRIQNSNFVFKQINNALCQLLPKWELNFKRQQLHRFKNLYKLIQIYKQKNMKYLYCVMKSEKNKQNISQFSNVCKMAKKQKEAMQELQKLYNNGLNLQNREKHRKQMQQIKYETNSVSNSLHQVSVEARIKRKTNAAYRMLNFTNTKNIKLKSDFIGNSMEIVAIKQIKNCIQREHYKYIYNSLPLWQLKLEKTIKKIKKRSFLDFIQCIHNFYT